MTISSTSFWSEIKKYEDILEKDPASYCFAPLSELYRKLGLIDDAVAVARTGTTVHPEYIGGFMALGRALFEKKEFTEAKNCLEKVARATPENFLAQKLLSQMYLADGNADAAQRALEVLVVFNPEDIESRLLLDSLRVAQRPEVVSEPCQEESVAFVQLQQATDSTGVLVEVVAEPYSVDSEQLTLDEDFYSCSLDEDDDGEEPLPGSPVLHGTVSTITLAELYESQGFMDNALSVYRDLLCQDPYNQLILARIDALERGLVRECASNVAVSDSCAGGETVVAEPVVTVAEVVTLTTERSQSDMVLETFEAFLDAITRRRECQLKAC